MTFGGPCSDCGAPLAGDQHSCLICGGRAPWAGAAAPVIVKRPSDIPMPPQMAVLIAVFALGFGGVVGSTLNGGFGGLIASAGQAVPTDLAADTSPDPKLASDTGGGTGGSSGPTTADPILPTAVPAPIAPLPVYPDLPADPPLDPPLKPPKEQTERAEGVVVRTNPVADSYSLASGEGALTTVHAKGLPAVGDEVKVPVETLFNTTLAETGKRKVVGEEQTTAFSGTVTHVDPKASRYVLSSAGSSVVIDVPASGEQQPADLPALTSGVTAEVDIVQRDQAAARSGRGRGRGGTGPADAAVPQNGGPSAACAPEQAFPEEPVEQTADLQQTSFTVNFKSLSYASMEGVVQASCPDSAQMVISADDQRQLGVDFIYDVPKEIDSSLYEPGQSVTVAANPLPGDDGALSLFGIAGDAGSKGADDDSLGQGDLAG